MPISKRWSKATQENLDKVPEKGGVYELYSFGELVYIGKADRNLRSRLGDHLRERKPNKFRYKTAGWLTSASSMEKKHITKYGRSEDDLPPWNDRHPR